MLYVVIVMKQKNTRHPFNSQTNILSSQEFAVHKRKLALTPKLAKWWVLKVKPKERIT